jgi:hypothetical protein
MSKASARSRSEPLTSSTPRASACRTKSSSRSEASASRKVKCLCFMSSPYFECEYRAVPAPPDRLATISNESGNDGASERSECGPLPERAGLFGFFSPLTGGRRLRPGAPSRFSTVEVGTLVANWPLGDRGKLQWRTGCCRQRKGGLEP